MTDIYLIYIQWEKDFKTSQNIIDQKHIEIA